MSAFLRLLLAVSLIVALASACLCRNEDEVEPPRRRLTNSLAMKFVLIPKGTFAMGSAKDDKAAADDEKPRHKVEITTSYFLGVTEVTQKQYRQVMGSNPSEFSSIGTKKGTIARADTDHFPVDNVSWEDAQTFLAALAALPAEKAAQRVYRLPTEAEWEYACRAGTKTAYSCGDQLAAKQANFGKHLGRTRQVGSYPPNAWGLCDMHGNVWEWCQDYAFSKYYSASPLRDPKGPAAIENGNRVHRGGCWSAPANECRSAHRSWSTPSVRDGRFGFRVVLQVK